MRRHLISLRGLLVFLSVFSVGPVRSAVTAVVADRGSDFAIGADGFATSAPLPNLRFATADFGPASPTILKPSDALTLGAFIENTGTAPSTPVWLEFWGSRTGGLMLDCFLAKSAVLGAIAPGGAYSFATSEPLYGFPDGRYTVVFSLDRPGQLQESNELDNRGIVRAKSLLVIRPQTEVDLALENFVSPWSGQVANRGLEASGPFWIEFWSVGWNIIGEKYFLMSWSPSIYVPNLGPGETWDLSKYSGKAHDPRGPNDAITLLCYVDRPDNINELDETNNYREVCYPPASAAATPALAPHRASAGAQPTAGTMADMAITEFDFSPPSPAVLKTGDPVQIHVVVENLGPDYSSPLWLEFWGSTLGGWNYDALLLDPSEVIPSLAAGGRFDLTTTKTLIGAPDGLRTVVAWIDRPGQNSDPNWDNNSKAARGKRLLAISPPTGANLALDQLSMRETPGQWDYEVYLRASGRVRNTGSGPSGPFWVEFWASDRLDYPQLNECLGGFVTTSLDPGQEYVFTDYVAAIYSSSIPHWRLYGCFVDRTDQVHETDETDNYIFLSVLP